MPVPDRLRKAIEGWRTGSIREFQREIDPICKTRRVRGSSYSMVHSYLRGDPVPPVAFLEIAAEVLGVRAAWLLSGEGKPYSETGGEGLTTITMLLMDMSPDMYATGGPTLAAAFLEAFDRLKETCPDLVGVSFTRSDMQGRQEETARLQELLKELIFEPLRLIRYLEQPGEWDYRQLIDYSLAMIHALMLAMPERGQGKPLAELIQQMEG